MIKTLRITSIVAAVLAASFFVVSAVFGFSKDPQAEQFLKQPGAIEEFTKIRGTKAKTAKTQISPLLKEAQAFASYLNPPKPKPKTMPARSRRAGAAPSAKHPPAGVSAKFDLIGTSYYAANPAMSLALLDMPGKGLRWFKQSSKLGHLILEKIKNGSIVIKDGKRTYEITAPRPHERSLLKGEAPIGQTESKPALTGFQAASFGQDAAAVQTTVDKEAATEQFIKDLKAIREQIKSSGEPYNEAGMAVMNSLIVGLETTRVKDDEAKKLGDLGKKLMKDDTDDVRGTSPQAQEQTPQQNPKQFPKTQYKRPTKIKRARPRHSDQRPK